ncbi:hypothetical protein PISMIDRAFT_683866 [Pisolithus microcarpus 441]|uniref:Uncharacterized protein n=1 Tax=Pisolithus microcarpus 441 TaxID=765257 RepID=A0A0C9YY43_9AGAM|nr:hypothetical protein PISMIDRAFT_683866 [Pisolithus microcarpus 441]
MIDSSNLQPSRHFMARQFTSWYQLYSSGIIPHKILCPGQNLIAIRNTIGRLSSHAQRSSIAPCRYFVNLLPIMRLGMQINVCPQMLQRLFSSNPFDVVELEGLAKKPSARSSGGTAGKKSVPQTKLHRYPLSTMLPHERSVFE